MRDRLAAMGRVDLNLDKQIEELRAKAGLVEAEKSSTAKRSPALAVMR
jgi:hypothetical protein